MKFTYSEFDGERGTFLAPGDLFPSQGVIEFLLEHDILIRDVGLPGHLRVTAGTPEETTEFLAVLARMGR